MAVEQKVRHIEAQVYHCMLPMFISIAFRLVYMSGYFYRLLKAPYALHCISVPVCFICKARSYSDSKSFSEKVKANIQSPVAQNCVIHLQKKCTSAQTIVLEFFIEHQYRFYK